MHLNVHSIIYNSQDVEKTQMPINGWIDKEDVVHIYNGILSMKKNEILPFAATWKNLEIIILSEVSQRKMSIIWYHLCVEYKK